MWEFHHPLRPHLSNFHVNFDNKKISSNREVVFSLSPVIKNNLIRYPNYDHFSFSSNEVCKDTKLNFKNFDLKILSCLFLGLNFHIKEKNRLQLQMISNFLQIEPLTSFLTEIDEKIRSFQNAFSESQELEELVLLEETVFSLNENNFDYVFNFISEKVDHFGQSTMCRILFNFYLARPSKRDLFYNLTDQLKDVKIDDILRLNQYKDSRINSEISSLTNYYRKREIELKSDTNNSAENKEKNLLQIIQNDDYEKFLELSRSIDFDINQEIDTQNQSTILPDNCSLINCSAFYGSEKIFNYLLLNKASSKSSVAKFAVAGGNVKIIHDIEINLPNFSFENTLNVAIYYHRNELFEWLIETKNVKFEADDLVDNILFFSNFRSLKYLIDQVNDFQNLTNSAFCNGNLLLVKLSSHFDGLIKPFLDEILEYRKRDNMLIKCTQKSFNDIVVFLLSFCNGRDSNILFKTENKDGQNLLHSCCYKNNFMLLQYLIDKAKEKEAEINLETSENKPIIKSENQQIDEKKSDSQTIEKHTEIKQENQPNDESKSTSNTSENNTEIKQENQPNNESKSTSNTSGNNTEIKQENQQHDEIKSATQTSENSVEIKQENQPNDESKSTSNTSENNTEIKQENQQHEESNSKGTNKIDSENLKQVNSFKLLVNKLDDNENTPLKIACEMLSSNSIEILLNLDEVDPNLSDPILEIFNQNSYEHTKIFLSNPRFDIRKTPVILDYAISSNSSLQIIELIMTDRRINSEIVMNAIYSLITNLSIFENLDPFRTMFSNIDLTYQDINGNTFLHRICKQCRSQHLYELIEIIVSINSQCINMNNFDKPNGQKPFAFLAANCTDDIYEIVLKSRNFLLNHPDLVLDESDLSSIVKVSNIVTVPKRDNSKVILVDDEDDDNENKGPLRPSRFAESEAESVDSYSDHPLLRDEDIPGVYLYPVNDPNLRNLNYIYDYEEEEEEEEEDSQSDDDNDGRGGHNDDGYSNDDAQNLMRRNAGTVVIVSDSENDENGNGNESDNDDVMSMSEESGNDENRKNDGVISLSDGSDSDENDPIEIDDDEQNSTDIDQNNSISSTDGNNSNGYSSQAEFSDDD